MSKRIYGTISEDNFTFVKKVIGLENWDTKLNNFINELREQKERNNGKNRNTK